MKKRKDAVRLCLSFLAAGLVLAIPVAAEEPLPEFGVLTQEGPALEDLQYTSLGGTPCIVEVYTVPPEYPSGEPGKDGFRKEGRDYEKEAVLKVKENYAADSRLASQTVTVSHAGKEGSAARFAPFLDYESGGYQGQLTLDASTILTEPAGTQSYSYPLSETREFTGLQRNDTYYIPKSVVKKGVTLGLSDVDWTAMGDGTCRARARYAGTGYGSRTTGYVSTRTYVGTVERRMLESITYKVIYAGKPIPVVKPSLWPWILSGLGVLVLAGGVLLFFRFKPNGKLCAVVGGTRLKTVRRLRVSRIHPFVDASAPEYGGYTLARQYHDRACSNHHISTKALRTLILETIRAASAFAISNEAEFIQKVRAASEVRQAQVAKDLKRKLNKDKRRCEELDTIIRKLYESYAVGRIGEERFDALLAGYEQEQTLLRQSITEAESALGSFGQDTANVEQFLILAKKYTDFSELTTPMINEFIEKIIVHAPEKIDGDRTQEVDIYLKFIGRFDLPAPELTPEEEKRLSCTGSESKAGNAIRRSKPVNMRLVSRSSWSANLFERAAPVQGTPLQGQR